MMFFQPNTLKICFKNRRGEKGGNSVSTPLKKSRTHEAASEEEAVLCKMCLGSITSKSEIISVKGSHYHTFANPEGIVFDISCFKTARGCSRIGPASAEFTWFEGYAWEIAVCSKCIRHIGWKFISDSHTSFYGLISDRLIYTRNTNP